MKGETWMKKLSPKELAWVRKFEEINHRKPTTRERRAAFAQRKKALRKKRAGPVSQGGTAHKKGRFFFKIRRFQRLNKFFNKSERLGEFI